MYNGGYVMSILEVKNVSIRYMVGDFKDIGLKEYILRKLKRNYRAVEFWADKDINFSLERGDMLGIIGTNGAGKSTLLKVISGIMEPTQGWVNRYGEVAALLELGSGFDSDLTVRENTYLRGAMLGYTRKFMDDAYMNIIRFAELEEYQDRPFKQLSSGMKSRLAFSIACLVQPDILILDEVLAVGDGAFKRKSEKKMQELLNCGATTILVSHALGQIRQMCNKVLWLHKGVQIAFGDDVKGICDRYEEFLMGDSSKLYGQGSCATKEMVEQENGKRILSIDELDYDLQIENGVLRFAITNKPDNRDLQFAYQIMLNGNSIYKQNYSEEVYLEFALKEFGTYRVVFFLMENEIRQYRNSEQVFYLS